MLQDGDLAGVTDALIQEPLERQGVRLLKRVRIATRRGHFSHRQRLLVKSLQYARLKDMRSQSPLKQKEFRTCCACSETYGRLSGF